MKKIAPLTYLLLGLLLIFFQFSCSKDSDLLAEYLIEESIALEEAANSGNTSGNESTTPDESQNPEEPQGPQETTNATSPKNPEPGANTNKIEGEYFPTSASDLSNPANANHKAIISNSFDCTGCEFAPGQTIVPQGGVITGTNIKLNGAYIENNYAQAFSSSVTFSEVYEKSRLSPETFGATSGDNGDDSAAIDALINNSAYAIARSNGQYIKNKPTNYGRSGFFDWNMNNAKVEITSSANFRMSQVSVDAVFDMTNLSPYIFNGEFDGNGVYGRLFYLRGQPNFAFDDLYVHDLYSPNAIRAVAFRFTMNVNSSGLTSGAFTNCTIENIVAQGDGNYNDGGGIAKVWWYTLSGFNSSTNFTVLHQNNTVRNIIGDDAEALYIIGGANVSHNGSFKLDNEDYRYCTRRAIKVCSSNVEVVNSYFEEIPESLFNAAQQMGSMLDFFSTVQGSLIENIWVHNNTIRTVPGNDSHYYMVAVTDAKDVTIENNVIETERLNTYGAIRLGSNTSFYSGDLSNIRIQNNILNNGYIQAMQNYDPLTKINVRANTFNFTKTNGTQVAAFRFYGSGTKGNVDFIDNTVNVDMSSPTGVNGVIMSDPAMSGVTNFTIDNTTITYFNGQAQYPFGFLQSNFDGSNSIKNSTLVGATGLNAIKVSGGSKSAQIINSADNNGNQLTIF